MQDIHKLVQESGIWQGRRALNLNQARPTAKQRVCRRTCDAAGFKVRDADAAKNRFLNQLVYKYILGRKAT